LYKGAAAVENRMAVPKKGNEGISYDPAITCGYITKVTEKLSDISTPMFIAPLVTVAKVT
jgi:hypothetical protein